MGIIVCFKRHELEARGPLGHIYAAPRDAGPINGHPLFLNREHMVPLSGCHLTLLRKDSIPLKGDFRC